MADLDFSYIRPRESLHLHSFFLSILFIKPLAGNRSYTSSSSLTYTSLHIFTYTTHTFPHTSHTTTHHGSRCYHPRDLS